MLRLREKNKSHRSRRVIKIIRIWVDLYLKEGWILYIQRERREMSVSKFRANEIIDSGDVLCYASVRGKKKSQIGTIHRKSKPESSSVVFRLSMEFSKQILPAHKAFSSLSRTPSAINQNNPYSTIKTAVLKGISTDEDKLVALIRGKDCSPKTALVNPLFRKHTHTRIPFAVGVLCAVCKVTESIDRN